MSQELNSIIAQLAEIDSASARIMQKAQNEKSQYAEAIELKKKEFDEALQKQNDEEIKEKEIVLEAQNKEQIADYDEQCAKQLKELEHSFEQNQTQWADEIFNKIIKE
jgi:hypothetical protein